MDPQFQELAERLEHRMQAHFESMEDLVKTAAEGYGANLDRIERELKALNKKMDTELGDHERVLAAHEVRITDLENRG